MARKALNPPKFELRFLSPKFWHIWLGVVALYLITWLPFRIILLLGKGFGRIIMLAVKKRALISRRNLQLTFPHWTDEQVEEVFQANIDRTGMALFETAMGWWWPDWRIKKHISYEGEENVLGPINAGKGVFGLAIHNVNLEFGCR
ncbi:MAG: lipid A biosynthesis acyltransferase, partial [Pseudomonadota bacterium]